MQIACAKGPHKLSFFAGGNGLKKIPREICMALPSAFHSQQSDAHFSTVKIIVDLACALASNLSLRGNCEPGSAEDAAIIKVNEINLEARSSSKAIRRSERPRKYVFRGKVNVWTLLWRQVSPMNVQGDTSGG